MGNPFIESFNGITTPAASGADGTAAFVLFRG